MGRVHSIVFILVACVACFLTVVFLKSDTGSALIARLQSDEQIVARLLRTDPCPAEDAKYTCWEGYYETLLAKYGSYVALFDLKGRYDEGGSPRTHCHTLLHVIGESAGKEYPSVAEAYKYGDTFCRSGYHHGVLEGVFGEEGSEALLGRLDSLCVEVDGKERYSYDYFSCVHGVGHGLMAYFNHDLFESLKGCDRLSGEWEQSSCYGGVFMENIIGDSPEGPSKFLKQDDAVYPCNAVEGKYKQQCYFMQTSHMLNVSDGDFATVFKECRGVEKEYRVACFQSLGRDASGWSYALEDDVLRYCGEGATSEERGQCLAGAATDFIQSSGVDAARALCTRGDTEEEAVCAAAIEYQISTL